MMKVDNQNNGVKEAKHTQQGPGEQKDHLSRCPFIFLPT